MEPEIGAYFGGWAIAMVIMLYGLFIDCTTHLVPMRVRRKVAWAAGFVLVTAGIAFRYYVELRWS